MENQRLGTLIKILRVLFYVEKHITQITIDMLPHHFQ